MLKSMMKAGASTDPNLKAVLDQYGPEIERARVVAFKVRPNGLADNVNITAVPAVGIDPERMGDGYSHLKPVLEGKFGARITGHSVTKVAGTNALRIEYRLTVAQQQMQGTQIYLVHNGNLLVVTVSQGNLGARRAEANTIVDGLRLQ